MLALWVGVGLFTGAGGTVVAPPPTLISGGAGNYNFLNRRKSKREDEDEKDEIVLRETRTVVKIGKAPHETITGLVIPKAKTVRAKGRNRLQEIEKANFDAAKAKSDRLRAIQLADDEWLLLN